MNRFIYFLLALIFFSCSEEELYGEDIVMRGGKIPCILVVGQSNADGRAPASTAPEWLKSNHNKFDNYAIWNRNTKTFQKYELGVIVGSDNNSDSRFSFDIFFADEYLHNHAAPLLCIKQTVGGIPISEKGRKERARWQPDVSKIAAGERQMVTELETKIKEAKAYAAKSNAELEIIAILYLQGESDAFDDERLNDFEKNFKNLISKLRELSGNSKIPIIASEILYRNDNYKRVNEILNKVAKKDKYLKVVSIKDHQSDIGDGVHFDAKALEYTGIKMYEYYLEFK